MKLFLRLSRNFTVTLNNYSVVEPDLTALRGQMIFRSKNLGVRELDLIVGAWGRHNFPQYSYEQLLQFNNQVLHHETPELLKKILGQLPIDPSETVISDIRQFALDSSFSKIENTWMMVNKNGNRIGGGYRKKS